MKQSVYNIIAIVLLIAGVGYLNIVAMEKQKEAINKIDICLLYTSPSPRDRG